MTNTEYLQDQLQNALNELEDAKARIAQLEQELREEKGQPDWLSQALNEGGGIYKP